MLISHFASASGGLCPQPLWPGPHHVNPSIVKSWVRLWLYCILPLVWRNPLSFAGEGLTGIAVNWLYVSLDRFIAWNRSTIYQLLAGSSLRPVTAVVSCHSRVRISIAALHFVGGWHILARSRCVDSGLLIHSSVKIVAWFRRGFLGSAEKDLEFFPCQ